MTDDMMKVRYVDRALSDDELRATTAPTFRDKLRSGREAKTFKPGQYGMKDSDLKASAAVLGIWLGDPVS